MLRLAEKVMVSLPAPALTESATAAAPKVITSLPLPPVTVFAAVPVVVWVRAPVRLAALIVVRVVGVVVRAKSCVPEIVKVTKLVEVRSSSVRVLEEPEEVMVIVSAPLVPEAGATDTVPAVILFSVKATLSAEPVNAALVKPKAVPKAVLLALSAVPAEAMLLKIAAPVEPLDSTVVTPVELSMERVAVPLTPKLALMVSIRLVVACTVPAAPTETFSVSVPTPPLSVSVDCRVMPFDVVKDELNVSSPEKPVKLSELVVSVNDCTV